MFIICISQIVQIEEVEVTVIMARIEGRREVAVSGTRHRQESMTEMWLLHAYISKVAMIDNGGYQLLKDGKFIIKMIFHRILKIFVCYYKQYHSLCIKHNFLLELDHSLLSSTLSKYMYTHKNQDICCFHDNTYIIL